MSARVLVVDDVAANVKLLDAKLSAAVGGAEGSEVTRRVQDIVRRAVGLHPDGAQIPAYPDGQQR